MKLKHTEESDEHNNHYHSTKSAERQGDDLVFADHWKGTKHFNKYDGSGSYFRIKIESLRIWLTEIDELKVKRAKMKAKRKNEKPRKNEQKDQGIS